MTFDHPFDHITVDQLRRAQSGAKWTRHPEALGAFIAEMDFGTAPAVVDALSAAVTRQQFGYLPDSLARDLAEACSDWHRDRYEWEVDPAAIRVVPDVIRGLQVAIEHFSEPGAVVVPTPAYMPFLTVPPALGREVIEVPMTDDGGRYRFDLDALAAAFAAGGTLLILCNPANPGGQIFSQAELLAVSKVVEAAGVRVYADEVHAPLIYPGGTHVPYASISPEAARHTITGTSASKGWNIPGLKCAQVILTNRADAARWVQISGLFTEGASNLGVVANTAAYRHGGPWLDGVLEYLDSCRRLLSDLLAERIPGARYSMPDATYLAWIDLRQANLGPDPSRTLMDAGLAVIDGMLCGTGFEGFVRLNFATPRPILLEIVERMAGAAAGSRSGDGR